MLNCAEKMQEYRIKTYTLSDAWEKALSEFTKYNPSCLLNSITFFKSECCDVRNSL